MSAEEIKEGHYKDKYGRWQPNRRSGDDRRALDKASPLAHERRKLFRRKLDREIIETDHQKMIDDALEDFAQEHDGHL